MCERERESVNNGERAMDRKGPTDDLCFVVVLTNAGSLQKLRSNEPSFVFAESSQPHKHFNCARIIELTANAPSPPTKLALV